MFSAIKAFDHIVFALMKEAVGSSEISIYLLLVESHSQRRVSRATHTRAKSSNQRAHCTHCRLMKFNYKKWLKTNYISHCGLVITAQRAHIVFLMKQTLQTQFVYAFIWLWCVLCAFIQTVYDVWRVDVYDILNFYCGWAILALNCRCDSWTFLVDRVAAPNHPSAVLPNAVSEWRMNRAIQFRCCRNRKQNM